MSAAKGAGVFVGVGVKVGKAVGVTVGVDVIVGVGEGTGVVVGVGIAVAVAVGMVVGVAVGTRVDVGVGIGMGVGVTVEVGTAPVSQATMSNARNQVAGRKNLHNFMETGASLRTVSNNRMGHLPQEGRIMPPSHQEMIPLTTSY
jgi:hypothetical protein